LRLVFNETQIMGCTLGPISGPRAEVVLQLHPFIIHPSKWKHFIFWLSPNEQK
jgi:hypothetical protein